MSTLTNIFLDIANSIRSKAGVATTYKPSEMAAAINNINTGGGSSTVYRYHILTKSTGGTDATITVEKYINESLISSIDYLYSNVKYNPVNYDDFFKIEYISTSQRITWLKNTIEHSIGYYESQSYSENVNFSISFTDSNDIIVGGAYPMNRFVGAFNAPITIAGDATDLTYLLYPIPQTFSSFNQPINIPETCTSLGSAFRECTSFNQPLNIPANVTSIGGMLLNCVNFNNPINIVEGSLSDIREAFRGCTNFNQPVYIPSTVTNAGSAFLSCTNFNQPINFSRNIDLPYTSFTSFLLGCTNFNSPINLSANVAIINMCSTLRNFDAPVTIEQIYANAFRAFVDCNKLNSPITINSAVGSTMFSGMFERCYNFNQPFTVPNNVTSVSLMFNQCSNFNSNVSFSETVYDYSNCFRDCINFNASINMPNTIILSSGLPSTMNVMFFNCRNFNQPLNVPNGINHMRDTFYNCYNFNQPLNIPNSVISLRNCFRYCYNFNQSITIPDSVTDLYATFLGCNNFENVVIVENAIKIPSANQSGTFQNCDNSKRKEIHIGVGTNMNNLIYKKDSASLVGAPITYSTNDVCAQNEAYNIYIYNDR